MKSQGTFCEHSLTFLIGSSALALVAHEHQREAHQQQPAADPDGADVRRHRAEHEGQERNRIPESHGPVAPQQRRAQKHDVARLRVGKDLPAADIGIGVLKAARERDEHGRMERVGHLPVKSGFEVQVARLLCVFLRAGLDFATIAGFIIQGKREGSGWKRI